MDFFDSDKFILNFMDKTDSWSLFYDEIGKLDFLQTMNWGYSRTKNIKQIAKYIIPEQNNEGDINSLNLYYYLVSTAIQKSKINSSSSADIGCGKGGGVNFINKCFKFTKSIGYDFSMDGLDKAKKYYKNNKKLKFEHLDVRKLQDCKKVDLVTNVESYHCYGLDSKFFENCYNMLNDNGILAMTDFVDIHKLNIIGKEASNFFDLLYLEDISPNVILSLNQKIRTNDTKIGVQKIKNKYPFIPDTILNKISYNFSGEQNNINMKQNKTLYFVAIFIKKVLPNNVVVENTRILEQYITDNLENTIGNKYKFKKYVKNTCILSRDTIICLL